MRKAIKNYSIIFFFGLLILSFGFSEQAKAQTIKVVGSNALNGTMNGVILGGATMALQNSDDFAPVRIGIGLGALYGIGIGVYDVTRTSSGEQLIVSGLFNDGTNTSIIVLLDTFYGAAAGAIIATSVTLIAKEPVLNGLQYGSSAGAWIGFGFGIFDAFVLSKKATNTQSYASSSKSVNGLITLEDSSSKIQAGFLAPGYTTLTSINKKSIQLEHSFKLDVLNLRINL